MHTRRTLFGLAIALTIAGCKKDDAKPAPSSSAGSGSGSAQATAPAGSVTIVVDDQPVGTIAAQQIGMWPRLDSLLPMAARRLGTWKAIHLTRNPAAAPVEITSPSARYPELVPALFPDDKGTPSFGMFDPVELAKHGTPAMRESGVTEIRIALTKGSGRGENDHHGGGDTPDPASLTLAIKSAGGDQVLDGAKLLSLTRDVAPGDSDGKGWNLSTLLAAAGVTTYERLRLTDVKGVSLTLEKQDLDPAAAIPFVKLNRQGQLRFRVFRKKADTWQPSSDLRGLAVVEVLK